MSKLNKFLLQLHILNSIQKALEPISHGLEDGDRSAYTNTPTRSFGVLTMLTVDLYHMLVTLFRSMHSLHPQVLITAMHANADDEA